MHVIDDYDKGVIHQRATKEILLFDGYKWIRPQDSNLPSGNFKIKRIIDPDFYVNRGDYFWEYGHGMSGRWTPVKKNNTLVNPYLRTVYAIKI